ncbi:MAG: hypothetical protein Q4C60_04345 [Eubacteriales bacterium]|nr:hypothetical protein [Eubacteriales bacterium]
MSAEGFIDMHCHILPAMDDGSPDMETSLSMARIAAREGIAAMICTPHNMPGKGRPSLRMIQERIDRLGERLEEEGIPIRLYPGCEHFYRSSVQEQLEAGRIVTLNGTRFVLVEFDPGAQKAYVVNALQAILGEDYTPVLAHVERYPALADRSLDTIGGLREQGVLIQVNCGSLMGDFGLRTKWLTRKLAREELIDFVATDAHSAGRRAPRMRDCAEWLYKACGRAYADRLLFGAAEQLI